MFPARQAISFHFVDYVVHSWDVARTLGVPLDLDPALLDVALSVAKAVPGGDARVAPGAAFAPGVDWPGGPRLDRIVALLGRSPDWKCPDTGRRPNRGRDRITASGRLLLPFQSILPIDPRLLALTMIAIPDFTPASPARM